jgi:uncharacterized protein involved in exopolysaccharide biosynthesis
MNSQDEKLYDDARVDLATILPALWRKKVIITFVTAIFCFWSIYYSLGLANQFRADLLVVPSSMMSTANKGLGGLGGLAAIAGVNIGSDGSSEITEAFLVSDSWGFVDEFIRQHNIAHQIFAANGYDPLTNKISYRDDLFDTEKNEWKFDESTGESLAPGSYQIYEKFKRNLSIKRDKMTGSSLFSYEHFSPEFSSYVVKSLVNDINSYMKEKALNTANRRIRALETELQNTAVISVRENLYDLISQNLEQKAIISSASDYALSLVGVPMVPEKRSSPQRAVIVILYTLLGGFLACFFVLSRFYYLQNYKKTSD